MLRGRHTAAAYQVYGINAFSSGSYQARHQPEAGKSQFLYCRGTASPFCCWPAKQGKERQQRDGFTGKARARDGTQADTDGLAGKRTQQASDARRHTMHTGQWHGTTHSQGRPIYPIGKRALCGTSCCCSGLPVCVISSAPSPSPPLCHWRGASLPRRRLIPPPPSSSHICPVASALCHPL